MNEAVTLLTGDCLAVLPTLPEASVDAIVTDPPYGLRFMGKAWDCDVPRAEVWRACLRVLKPGGHLLAFAGTRTQHRMAVAIEDAGFEIRDLLAWAYGSGFPKSLDVSKAIDKAGGESGRLYRFTAWMRSTGLTAAQINAATGTCMGSHYLTDKSQSAIPTSALWAKLRPLCGDVPVWVDDLVDRIEAEREVIGQSYEVPNARAVNPHFVAIGGKRDDAPVAINYAPTAPATDAARQWAGWGTALKPALEPITLARKPLDGTVAETVLRHGTGAINVEACRLALSGDENMHAVQVASRSTFSAAATDWTTATYKPSGRWPANLLHDGSDEATAPLGAAARFFYSAKASRADRDAGLEGFARRSGAETVERAEDSAGLQSPRAGAGRTSGGRNHHPTVKPTDLMRYLVRLVTPPGGVVLDPFMGSGSTGKAAVLEGARFVGIERDPDYAAIAAARIAWAEALVERAPEQPDLFDAEVTSDGR